MFMFLEIIYKIGKFSYIVFWSKLRSLKCTQIAKSDEDLLWDIADNSMNYCSNDLKKLPDVVLLSEWFDLHCFSIFAPLFEKLF